MTHEASDDITVYEFVDDTTRRLAHLAGIAQDLAAVIVNCRSFKVHLDDAEMNEDIKRSLWLAALVHYGRAFDTAAGLGIGPEELMAELTGDPMGAHNQYLKLLGHLSAPAEDPFERVRVGLTMNIVDGEAESVTGTGVFFMEAKAANHELVELLEMLSEAIHEQVLELGKQAESDVLQAAGKVPLAELSALPQFNPMAGHHH